MFRALDPQEDREPAERASKGPPERLGEVGDEALQLARGQDGGRGDVTVEPIVGEQRDRASRDLVGDFPDSSELDLAQPVVCDAEADSPGHRLENAGGARQVRPEHQDALQIAGEPDARDHLGV